MRPTKNVSFFDLVEQYGLSVTLRLIRDYGGYNLRIPSIKEYERYKRDLTIYNMYVTKDPPVTIKQLSKAFGLSVNSINAILRRMRKIDPKKNRNNS